MERIKLIVFASLIMCSTIFVSSFFYLKPLAKEDVYAHMNEQVEDIFQSINLPLENGILTQEEFDQAISSNMIKERVKTHFESIDTNSLYSFDEDIISEVSTCVDEIYKKELQREEQEEANKAIFLIKTLSASGCIVACGILFLLFKKKVDEGVKKEQRKVDHIQEESSSDEKDKLVEKKSISNKEKRSSVEKQSSNRDDTPLEKEAKKE